MACTKEHKVFFGTHMLSKEVEDWWGNARQRLEVVGDEITWFVFMVQFLDKYFPKDVHNKKEIEFLELKQWNVTFVEYASKFKKLVNFCPYYNGAAVEGSKCIKFESEMQLEIKQGIGYQEIHMFLTLVNTCMIYGEDCIARSSHYKSVSERKGKNQYRGKPYSAPTDRGK